MNLPDIIVISVIIGYVVVNTTLHVRKYLEEDRVRKLKKEILEYLEDVQIEYQETASSYENEQEKTFTIKDLYEAQAHIVQVCAHDIKGSAPKIPKAIADNMYAIGVMLKKCSSFLEIGGPTRTYIYCDHHSLKNLIVINNNPTANMPFTKGIEQVIKMDGKNTLFKDKAFDCILVSCLPYSARNDVIKEIGRIGTENCLVLWQGNGNLADDDIAFNLQGFKRIHSNKEDWAVNYYRHHT